MGLYFGVPDLVNYENIPWRSNRFDEEALTAATLHGARALGREQDYGTIESGKLASFVVLEEDPTQDVRALRKVVAVVHRGKLHRPAGSEVPVGLE